MEQRVKSILSSVLGINITRITEKTSIDTVSDWSSMKHMNLIVALEEEFEIEFDEDEIVESTNYIILLNNIRKKTS